MFGLIGRILTKGLTKKSNTLEFHKYRELNYTLQRKQMKNLIVKVKSPDGQVVVSAPHSASLAKIEEFLDAHLAWIAKQRAEMHVLPQVQERNYQSGETLYIWGKPYTLEVVEAAKVKLGVLEDKLYLYLPEGTSTKQREAIVDKWLKHQLELHLPQLFAQVRAVVGKTESSYYIRKMTSRWGTCNVRTGRVCINLNLVHLHPEFLIYIITHELNHLWVPNHGPAFKANMDRFYPKWRAARTALKKVMYMLN